MPIAVQLATGKTIYVDTVRYLTMTDQEFEALTADDIGTYVDNPFSEFSEASEDVDIDFDDE